MHTTGAQNQTGKAKYAALFGRVAAQLLIGGLLLGAVQPVRAQSAAPTSEPTAPATPASLAELRESVRELQRIDHTLPPVLLIDAEALKRRPTESSRPRAHRGMLTAGWTLLVAGYLPALIYGSLWGSEMVGWSQGAIVPGQGASSFGLLVPVAGPFISGIAVLTDDEKHYSEGGLRLTFMTYSLPWMLADGLGQIAGLALILTAYKHPQIVRENLGPLSQLKLTPYAQGSNAGLVLSGAF